MLRSIYPVHTAVGRKMEGGNTRDFDTIHGPGNFIGFVHEKERAIIRGDWDMEPLVEVLVKTETALGFQLHEPHTPHMTELLT